MAVPNQLAATTRITTWLPRSEFSACAARRLTLLGSHDFMKTQLSIAAVVLGLLACSNSDKPQPSTPNTGNNTAPTPVATRSPSPPPVKQPVAKQPPTEQPVAKPAPIPVAPPAKPSGPAKTVFPTLSGKNFAAQARAVFRVAACGDKTPVQKRFGPANVRRHCVKMRSYIAEYNKRWVSVAKPFIANLRPKNLPDRVVYPFGGGDFMTALSTFPDARLITTISLEKSGDIRPIDTMSKWRLKKDLDLIGDHVGKLLRMRHSETKHLQEAARQRLPGTVVFTMVGLAIHGYEPVSMHYFDYEPDGRIKYMTGAELDKREKEQKARARKKKKKWRRGVQAWRAQSAVYANMELRYRKLGDASAPIKVYRHIVANLDWQHLKKSDAVLKLLKSHGKFAVMTKAASYLLWLNSFYSIRNFLLKNMVWMISDSSGIPPRYAKPAGFEQITFGGMKQPYFPRGDKKVAQEMINLWKTNPRRKLPFRFGYPSKPDFQNHMMVTRPKPQK